MFVDLNTKENVIYLQSSIVKELITISKLFLNFQCLLYIIIISTMATMRSILIFQ